MNTKVLIVLLVLLVILFAVGIGLGVMPRAEAQDMPALVTRLQATLLGAQPRLGGADIDLALPAVCADQFAQQQLRLPAGQSCIFFMGNSQAPVRSVQLEIAPGQRAEVIFAPASANRFTAKQRLEPDRRTLTVDVFAEGGELRITCMLAAVGDTCLLNLE
jgi:hypothetical protein